MPAHCAYVGDIDGDIKKRYHRAKVRFEGIEIWNTETMSGAHCIAPVLFGNKGHMGPFFHWSEKYGRVHFVDRKQVFTEECDRSAQRVSNIGDSTIGFQCSLLYPQFCKLG